ncbi:hypothetical protein HNV12_06505 [Methanococcoides sp. SA1]|nr:hypothetical protein [Methanococcoides sp. SA1]
MDIKKHLELTQPNFAKWILVYYWGAIEILNFDLPLVLSQANISRVTLMALGYLICYWTQNNQKLIDEYIQIMDYLNVKTKSPKLMTSWGVYSWTGESYLRNVNGLPYRIFHEGVNYLGSIERGDKVFMCPEDQAVQIGPHILIKSDIELKEPDEVTGELRADVGDAWVIKGTLPAQIFGSVDVKSYDLKRELDAQTAYNSKLVEINKEQAKCLSDAYMLQKSGQHADQDKLDYKELLSAAKGLIPT